MARNQFIDEGIATFFNEENTYEEFILKYKNNIPNIDIVWLWNKKDINFNDKKDIYYLAAAFVGFLIEFYGKEKFLKFIHDESYENAKRFFSPSVDIAIQQFYKKIWR